MKIAVLFHRFGPYHRARLDAAGRLASVVGVELSGETQEYAWDRVNDAPTFRRVTLFPDQDSRAASSGAVRQAVSDALSRERPDAVAVPGWSERGALAALLWCLETHTPAVMMSESTRGDFERAWWKEAVKAHIVSACQAGLVGGSAHAQYIQELGLSPSAIFMGYDVVENDFFARGARAAQREESAARLRLRLPDSFFLASGRFIPKKNIRRLLAAYAHYRAQRGRTAWHLVLLGDGPQREDVVRWVAAHGLEETVHLPGFKQYEDLPAYYGLASAFVHASTTEQWGLVVNEAMAAGLPVLVSDRCGCAPDLVAEGENGFTFDPYDAEALAALLEKVAHGSCGRAAMGRESRERIADWGPERFASGLEKAVGIAKTQPERQANVLDTMLMKALAYR